MGDELDDYSAVAEQQLDTLEVADPGMYNDMLAICELIFSNPSRAQSMATAVQTRFPHFAESFQRHLRDGVVDAGGDVEEVEDLLL